MRAGSDRAGSDHAIVSDSAYVPFKEPPLASCLATSIISSGDTSARDMLQRLPNIQFENLV